MKRPSESFLFYGVSCIAAGWSIPGSSVLSTILWILFFGAGIYFLTSYHKRLTDYIEYLTGEEADSIHS